MAAGGRLQHRTCAFCTPTTRPRAPILAQRPAVFSTSSIPSPPPSSPLSSASSSPTPPLLPSERPHNLFRSPLREVVDDDDGPLSAHALVVEPARLPHRCSLIWLTGLGESLTSLRGLFQATRLPHLRVVAPRAPRMPITGLGEAEERSWYDLLQPRIGEGMKEDEEGIDAMAERVRALIDEEVARGLPHHRIALAGVAQGGALAVHVAMAMPQGCRLAGVASVSGYLALPSRYPTRLSEEGKRTPLLVVHGKADRAIEWDWAQRGWEALEKGGVRRIECRVEHSMDHHLTHRHFADTLAWIEEVTRRDTNT